MDVSSLINILICNIIVSFKIAPKVSVIEIILLLPRKVVMRMKVLTVLIKIVSHTNLYKNL